MLKFNNMVRVRIAPSPTGKDLHIGNVYTALINFAFAKQKKGKFILRIEDTDRKRFVPGAEARILSSLKWLGLLWDEGPDVGGEFGPYRQSERLPLYKYYAHKLVKEGKAYFCFCSKERLERMRKEQQKKGLPTRYDGFCRERKPPTDFLKKPYVIRLKTPEDGVTEYTDLIRGRITFENKLLDDQILLKSDGYPTYHLAVVVDDHLMKITHVIRAEEWISSTPKQIILYNYLGWTPPQFAHLPLLRKKDRSKLSKRRDPVWVSWYREQGFLPEAILNYLCLMGWSMPDGREIFSLSEFIKNFSFERMSKSAPVFDLVKLEWLNGEYIRAMEEKGLCEKIFEFLGKKYDKELICKTIPLIKERIKKFSDYLKIASFFFEEPRSFEEDISGYRDFFVKFLEKMDKFEWTSKKLYEASKELIGEFAKSKGVKPKKLFMALRIAITGKKVGPPLFESMELLGKGTVERRIKKVI